MSHHRLSWARLLTAALWLSAWSLAAVAQTGTALRLGVVPQFPSLETVRLWSPIARAVGEACGQPVELQVSLSIPQFEEQFLKGDFDIVYMNPYHAVMAHKAQGYVPLVRDGQRSLKGILVVRADSPYRTVTDLAGEIIAYPAPNAFGASLYMRALLEREFKVSTRSSYVRTHSNAYRHVLASQAQAAGGVKATLDSEPVELRNQLRVLYETPPVAPHPLMAHPRVPSAVQACIQQHLITAAPDSELGQLVSGIPMTHPAAANYERDYQPLARLGLEGFVVREEQP